jgi:outer membrane putative beta-barrel porin/alpha-amylase
MMQTCTIRDEMVFPINWTRHPKIPTLATDRVDDAVVVISLPHRDSSFTPGTTILLWVLLLVIASSHPAMAATADPTWQVGGSITHSSGDYGTGSTTTITYIPITIRRLFNSGDISLVIPYLSVTGDCGVTLLSGTPNSTGGTCPTRTTTTPSGRGVTRTLQTRTTESGLGDIILRGRYYLLDGTVSVPTVALIAREKFPTADSARGLGTGRFDETLGMELTQRLPSNFVAFADTGYTFIGHVQGVGLRNQWYYDLGLGYYFTKTLLGSVYYEEWRAVVQGFQNPQDLLFALNWTATDALRFNTALQFGLSDGAPAYGITFGASLRF